VIKQVQGHYPGKGKGKGTAIFELNFRLPEFIDSLHMKVVRLLALHTSHLYTTQDITGTHLCWRLSRPQGRSAAGRFQSEKNANDPMGDRTRDLSACRVLPQPTALPRVTLKLWIYCIITAQKAISNVALPPVSVSNTCYYG
jgi:hypothetical protein